MSLAFLHPEEWAALTTTHDDFNLRAAGNADFYLTNHFDHRVLLVVKKNVSRLRALIKWLSSARGNVLAACPTLIIDDEADQASLNASRDPARRTTINQLTIDLLRTPPKAAYVGYTATPFANLLVDVANADDLYPRDFIVDLPSPADYFGPERLFGRDRLNQEEGDEVGGLDMIRLIPDEDVPLVKPPSRGHGSWTPVLGESLHTALDYFLLAATARTYAGRVNPPACLSTRPCTRTSMNSWQLLWLRGRPSAVSNWPPQLEMPCMIWNCYGSTNASACQPKTSIRLRSHLESWNRAWRRSWSALEVVVENSRSPIRLDYSAEGHPIVAIGGNTLSRGLTLVGLIVSYFVRTASAYDTLLQMGRWFGYRRGYPDLPRVWMTAELARYFFDLATVEYEIRQDIKLYELEDITPTEFAVRIRTHPVLGITARSKMQTATESFASYSGRRPQMIFYRYRDEEWLAQNSGRRLVASRHGGRARRSCR